MLFTNSKLTIAICLKCTETNQRSGSLLNVSVPDPLCVDLEQDGRVIRRFCRPFDVTTGLGEFLEQKTNTTAVVTLSCL